MTSKRRLYDDSLDYNYFLWKTKIAYGFKGYFGHEVAIWRTVYYQELQLVLNICRMLHTLKFWCGNLTLVP